MTYYQITTALQHEVCYRIEGCTCFNILIFHWQGKHKKAYGTKKEHDNRKAIFAANHERIHKHNSNTNKTYSQEHNFLSDLVTKTNIVFV